MKESVKKAILIGIGLGEVTKQKAEQIAKELLKKGEASDSEMKKFALQIAAKAEAQKKKIEAAIRTEGKKAAEKVLARSEQEINRLSKRLKELQAKTKPKKAHKVKVSHKRVVKRRKR